MVVWPVLLLWLCIGDGSFRCSLKSFSKGPRDFSYVFLITCKVPHMEPVDGPLCFPWGPGPSGKPGF